jgi:hypothetical protein
MGNANTGGALSSSRALLVSGKRVRAIAGMVGRIISPEPRKYVADFRE